MVKVKSLFQKGYLGLVLLFLYAPIATLIIFSLSLIHIYFIVILCNEKVCATFHLHSRFYLIAFLKLWQ